MIENTTFVVIPPPTYGDGLFDGFALAALAILLLFLLIVWAQRRVVHESIFNPEAFKVRQDEYQRKLKDW